MIDIDDVPDQKKLRYPERINVPVTKEVKKKLDFLRLEQKKDTAELVRILLNDFLETIDWGVEA